LQGTLGYTVPLTTATLCRSSEEHQESSEGLLVLEDMLRGAIDGHVGWKDQELLVPRRIILVVHDHHYNRLRRHIAPIFDRCLPNLVEE
jgi:hypothetical protein